MISNVSSMSNAELIQWSKNLENSNSAQNAELKAAVAEELKLRKLDADTATFTSSTAAVGNNFDAAAVNETMESIAADAAELQEYDNQYNDLVSQQTDLETQCQNFKYPDVESIKTSSQAAKVLKDVEAQIQRIEQLIKTALNLNNFILSIFLSILGTRREKISCGATLITLTTSANNSLLKR